MLEKSHGSLSTEENREVRTSMKGLPRVQLTKKEEETEIGDIGLLRIC